MLTNVALHVPAYRDFELTIRHVVALLPRPNRRSRRTVSWPQPLR
jgi:hypothetical protein